MQGLELGADGYLAQPFEGQELVATVHALVRLSRAEQDLRTRAEELQAAGRRKDEFLAMLAHELRNPLSAISASLPLLSRHAAHDGTEERAREIVQRQVRQLSGLVDDLLDVARVTQGKIELHRSTIDLAELLVRTVCALRDTKARPRRQTMTLSLPDGPLWVDGDPMRLEQIFANLIDNACKYTPEGGSVTISVSKRPSDGRERLNVKVCDTGMGIAADGLSQIFELFSQVAVAIDRSRGGLGIGLTLVRTLVGLHGGRVSASSEGPGMGAVFEVELPCASPASTANSKCDQEPSGVHKGVARRRRVLLVEDNDDARQGLMDLWQLWGHEVIPAGDGAEAIERALADEPDIAFVDIGLPELDGYEVARRLRANPRSSELLLVALTGYGSPEQKGKAFEAGFDHHLLKPVEPAMVRKLIDDLSATRASSRRRSRSA
ncbi:MAG: ATP-binding protein [Myxococcales bacterium]